ncbi:flagellar biosynthesis anti-sigma factor FlgM [Paraburkholderia sp.]|uniref:flagellar biosynthesis anti-sigma factor FlgM n=1 Tax=Paraburkholderia sp. TaxID=1926495 RepID=UPI002383904C|nr:flagellar biosynthesis anti-sigma factor FlgM [Paraburkholderia sp.]MDE1181238.1 flagellar biosynthesis anti-sigma factor FlgM [Paraburkholderia sp.]
MKVDSSINTSLPTLTDGVSRSQQNDTTAAAAGNANATATSQTSSAGQGDASVNLSGLSQNLRGLAASGSADIDTANVDAIKAAIRNGTLQIDSGKIADGVLDTARGLLSTQTPPSN